MSIGGALELIHYLNNPEIIDAPDNSLQEGKLHSRWKLLTVLRVTENDAKSLSKGPCLVALNMCLTLHLLLFG